MHIVSIVTSAACQSFHQTEAMQSADGMSDASETWQWYAFQSFLIHKSVVQQLITRIMHMHAGKYSTHRHLVSDFIKTPNENYSCRRQYPGMLFSSQCAAQSLDREAIQCISCFSPNKNQKSQHIMLTKISRFNEYYCLLTFVHV